MKEFKKESVLCVYTQDAEKLELLSTQKRNVLNKLNDNNHLFMFQSRCQIEENTNVVQLIPYIFFEDTRGNLLLYKRKGSEERLQDLYSFGVGGHVNLSDIAVFTKDLSIDIETTLLFNLNRECHEELYFTGSFDPYEAFSNNKLQCLGVIYKTNSMVDLVHLGLVFKYKCNSDIVNLEKSELKPVWASLSEIKELYPNLENWSKELYDNFIS